MKKLANILIWIVLAAWFVVILGFVSGEASEILCKRIDVHISDTLSSRFVTDADVRHVVQKVVPELQGYPIDAVNTRKIEATLEENPYIRAAEVCKDVSGTLSVYIEQRIPLLRIMPEGRKGFYLDMEAQILPLSRQYVPHILVVSGFIDKSHRDGSARDFTQLYNFSKYLAFHPLWKEQIVQVYVDKNGSVELVPRVGAHQILLGELDDWKVKMDNLELLYKQGFTRYGWNTYGKINLKYQNQIICTKR